MVPIGIACALGGRKLRKDVFYILRNTHTEVGIVQEGKRVASADIVCVCMLIDSQFWLWWRRT